MVPAVPDDRMVPAIKLAQADLAAEARRRTRTEIAKPKLLSLLTEMQTFFADEIGQLSPNQRLARVDEYLTRYRALDPEVADTPLAQMHADTMRGLSELRAALVADTTQGNTTANAAEGPHQDFEWLGQQAVMALSNPLQREAFRASLARGIDFNVGVSAIERTASGWLVQLSGRPGVTGTPGQGLFCRVESGDAASLTVLRTVMPPYGIVRVNAPGAEDFFMQTDPLRIRVVFGPCRITTPSDRPSSRPSGGQVGMDQAPSSAPRARQTDRMVAPSPPDLHCTTRPSRFAPEYAMARRLRQAWAIPEPLRADPSLMLTFAVTLNFDAQLQAAPRLLRSQSQHATPEQLNAAVDAADRAICVTAPFPELGQFAGGTMQIDMTPCD